MKLFVTDLDGTLYPKDMNNKKEIFERMDNQLKKLDSSYIMTFSGIYNNNKEFKLTVIPPISNPLITIRILFISISIF